MFSKGLPSQMHRGRLLGDKEETCRIPALQAQMGKEDVQRAPAPWDVGGQRGMGWHRGKMSRVN